MMSIRSRYPILILNRLLVSGGIILKTDYYSFANINWSLMGNNSVLDEIRSIHSPAVINYIIYNSRFRKYVPCHFYLFRITITEPVRGDKPNGNNKGKFVIASFHCAYQDPG